MSSGGILVKDALRGIRQIPEGRLISHRVDKSCCLRVEVPGLLTKSYLPMYQRTKGNGGVKALPANLNENGTANGTVVTIAKWDLYQGKKNAKRNESGTKNEFLPITEKEEKNIYLELRFLNTEKVK